MSVCKCCTGFAVWGPAFLCVSCGSWWQHSCFYYWLRMQPCQEIFSSRYTQSSKNRFGYWDTSSHNCVICVCACVCVSVWYEPTDADKACKPFVSESWKALTYTSPNLAELCTMNQTLCLPTPQGISCYQTQMITNNSWWSACCLYLITLLLTHAQEHRQTQKKASDDSFPVLPGKIKIKHTQSSTDF